MYERDAEDYEILMLQNKLAANGISHEDLDLGDYAGLTYTQLKGIVDRAIQKKKEG